MEPLRVDAPEMELGDFIEAYESAQARNGHADLSQFLPPSNHSLYGAVLKELIRVDLEYGWQRGRPTPLAQYQRRFPDLFRTASQLQEIAFEEYRLRQQAGESPSPSEYRRAFGVQTDSWPAAYEKPRSRLRLVAEAQEAANVSTAETPANGKAKTLGPTQAAFADVARAYEEYRRRQQPQNTDDLDQWLSRLHGSGEHARVFQELHRSDPKAASRLAQAVINLPDEGVDFLGFRLLKELGQGAFARVYLAQQSGLANRYVALKVAADLAGESQTLAQMQHTNIMPIYSIHHAPPFQAVCMPYFGSTTLAHVLKDIEGRPSLPESGKGLVSTLSACKHSTRKGTGNAKSSTAAAPADQLASELPEEVLALPSGGDSTDTLRQLEGMTYVEAVLWIAARLADGLAHAHDRGILHLDLKPANILLTDEGQPMLLDFNLSKDVKRYLSPSAAYVGGTLPYMAPEHLEAFRGGNTTVDERSDLFSFGVILYELLTGRSPYLVHRGQLESVLAGMIDDRRQPPPRIRGHNPAISPAVEAIIRRCMEPDPNHRYQAARELYEDLKRHLDSLPLKHTRESSLVERTKKWVRRHPFVTSTTTLITATILLVVFAGGVLWWNQGKVRRLQAQTEFNELRENSHKVHMLFLDRNQMDQVLAEARQLLNRYHAGAPASSASAFSDDLLEEQQAELREILAESAFVAAETCLLRLKAGGSPADSAALDPARKLHDLAASFYAPEQQPVSLLRQAADLARVSGQPELAGKLTQQAAQGQPRTVRDQCWTAYRHTVRGEYRKALPLWQQALRQDPKNYLLWYSVGHAYVRLAEDAADGGEYTELSRNQDQDAVAHISGSIALAPDNHRLYFERGLAYYRLRHFDLAQADFDRVIQLQPDRPFLADAYLHRGLAQEALKNLDEAVRDWNKALELSINDTRVYFLLARAHERRGEHEAARLKFEEGLKREPTDAKSWEARGFARMRNDAKGALADLDRALERDPSSLKALQNKAYILSELLGRTDDALAVLDLLVDEHPDYTHGRVSRGVLLARLGRRDQAHRDVRTVLGAAQDREGLPLTLYQAACTYALTSRQEAADKTTALRFLSEAVKQGLLSLAVQGNPGIALLEKDPDLNPLRDEPEFRRVLEAARTVHSAASAPKPAAAGGN